MKNYNPINSVLFFLASIVLVILIACEFESVLATLAQILAMLVCALLIKVYYYDFNQWYKQL